MESSETLKIGELKPMDENSTVTDRDTLVTTAPVQQSDLQVSASTYNRIIARHSGKRLEVEFASTEDGARILMANGTSGTYQPSHWRFDWVPGFEGRFVTIRNRNSDKYLDVNGASTDTGALVVQFTRIQGNFNQHFFLERVGVEDYYAIWARHSQKYIEVFGGLSDGHPPLVQSGTRVGQPTLTHQHFRLQLI